MTNEEAKHFHAVADSIWEMAKKAKADGHHDLYDTLVSISDMLHARASGIRQKYDSQI